MTNSLMAVTAPFALIYLPSKPIVPGDATATADRVRASEGFFRFGIGIELAGIAYLASAGATLVLPRYADMVGQVVMVLYFGELPFMFWLLIWGVKRQPTVAEG